MRDSNSSLYIHTTTLRIRSSSSPLCSLFFLSHTLSRRAPTQHLSHPTFPLHGPSLPNPPLSVVEHHHWRCHQVRDRTSTPPHTCSISLCPDTLPRARPKYLLKFLNLLHESSLPASVRTTLLPSQLLPWIFTQGFRLFCYSRHEFP